MKITVNSEFAKRYLGVAILFLGLSLWFLYDAVFVYPNKPLEPGEHRTTVEFQYSAAALLAIASFFIGSRVWFARKRIITWDDKEMSGPGVGAKSIAFSEIVGVDDSQWDKKGIIKFITKDGHSVKLDAWTHSGVNELVEKIIPKKV